MNIEEIIEALRQRGYLLAIYSQKPGVAQYPTKYSARFWLPEDSNHIDFTYADALDRVIRQAAIRICKQRCLSVNMESDPHLFSKVTDTGLVWIMRLTIWSMATIMCIKLLIFLGTFS